MSRARPEHLFLSGPAGRLEAIWQPGAPGKPAAVVCHPHPLYGGTMRNRVVYWLARVLEEAGVGALRFNFRGVGASEGSWTGGEGEAEDARAALAWLRARGVEELWVAGFSFGCYAGLRAGFEAGVTRWIAVAPAVNHWDFGFARAMASPGLVVVGGEDEVVPPEAVMRWAETVPAARLVRVPGAGHFFEGETMRALVSCARAFVREGLEARKAEEGS